MSTEDVEREGQEDGSAPDQKLPGSDAAGPDDSVPSSGDGVGIGAGTETNTFEPEEDPDAIGDNNADS